MRSSQPFGFPSRRVRQAHTFARHCLPSLCIAVILSAILSFVARAQTSRTAASLEGRVSDTSGAIVPGAMISLRNTSTNQSRNVRSDDSGIFRAEELPVGAYEIRVDHAGFAPYRQTNLDLSLGQTIQLDIALSPASASSEIVVTAQAGVLDTSQTSVVSSVDQERIEELPVRSRNYLDFVLLAPGVSTAPTTSAAGGSAPSSGSGFTFGGLRPRSNNVSIDGLDNNDEYTGASRIELSPEIVQEFQVVNNGLSAESGGASGGSINVITRSGTNAVHGDAFIFAQDSALNARPPFETQREKPSFRRFRAGFALGGPVVRDRSFAYAAIEQEHNRGQFGSDIDPATASTINAFLASGALPGLPVRHITTAFSPMARAETETAGRFDQRLTNNTSLMLRYAFTNNKESGDAFNTSGLLDASAHGSSFTSDNTLSASLTTVLGSNAVSDLRFQAATRHAVARTNQIAGPEIDITGLVDFGRPYSGNLQRRENHYQADYTYTRSHGKHLWKLGATVNRVALHADVPDGFGGTYLFATLSDFLTGTPDQFRQTFGNSRVGFPVTSFAGFAQDHWSLTRTLTIDLGVRYDFEHLPAQFHQDAHNFSPRIGLAWSPASKWVFRGGFGIFFDRYVLADLSRAVEKNGVQAFEQVVDASAAASIVASASGGSLPASLPGVAPSIFLPDRRMATPYSEQASAGAEHALAANLTVRADYLFIHGVKLPRTVNTNLLPPTALTLANAPSIGIVNPSAQQIGRDLFSSGRANPQFTDIYSLQDRAGSTYNGVSFTLSRKMNEELEFSASYTLSKTLDDASDFDEQPQNPFNLAAEHALSRQHQQQRFVFNALWDLPIGEDEDAPKPKQAPANTNWATRAFEHIELAPIFSVGSGRPVDPLTGLDSNRTHAFPLSARPLGYSRNSIQIPRNVTVDLRAVKYFPFGGVRRLDLVAEAFNLFNHANVAEINPFFGSSLTPIAGFAQPIEATGARQVQFSLDFEF